MMLAEAKPEMTTLWCACFGFFLVASFLMPHDSALTCVAETLQRYLPDYRRIPR